MNKHLLNIFFFLCVTSYSQNFDWARISNDASIYGRTIIKPDNMNNLIVVSHYAKSTTSGYIRRTLIGHYDANGALLSQDSLCDFYVYDFEVASDNSIYITGYLQDTVGYVGNLRLSYTSGPWAPGYIIRFFSKANAAIIDHSENNSGICYHGEAIGIKRGTDNSMFFYGSRNLLPGNDKELFLVKYHPSLGFISNSTVLHARVNQFCPGLAQDGSGNLYMMGLSVGGAVFGSTNIGTNATFLAKADSSGNFTSAAYVPSGLNYATYCADKWGNVYFGSGENLYKFSPSGSILWTKFFSSSAACDFFADKNGSVYLAGYFVNTSVSSQFESNTYTGFGSYFTKLDPVSGNILWLKVLNSPAWMSSVATAAYSDGAGNIYFGGGINDTVAFGNTTLTFTYGYPTPTGYLTKITESVPTVITNETIINEILLFPNPSSGIFTLKGESTQAKISVHDILGNCVWNKEYRNEAEIKIDLSDQPKGIYFVEFVSGDERAVRKIVVE